MKLGLIELLLFLILVPLIDPDLSR